MEVFFTDRALKDLYKLPADVQKRIVSKLKQYSEEPLTYSKRLLNSKIGTYRFRIGVYRVIFDIEDNIIVVLRVGHRRDVYR